MAWYDPFLPSNNVGAIVGTVFSSDPIIGSYVGAALDDDGVASSFDQEVLGIEDDDFSAYFSPATNPFDGASLWWDPAGVISGTGPAGGEWGENWATAADPLDIFGHQADYREAQEAEEAAASAAAIDAALDPIRNGDPIISVPVFSGDHAASDTWAWIEEAEWLDYLIRFAPLEEDLIDLTTFAERDMFKNLELYNTAESGYPEGSLAIDPERYFSSSPPPPLARTMEYPPTELSYDPYAWSEGQHDVAFGAGDITSTAIDGGVESTTAALAATRRIQEQTLSRYGVALPDALTESREAGFNFAEGATVVDAANRIREQLHDQDLAVAFGIAEANAEDQDTDGGS